MLKGLLTAIVLTGLAATSAKADVYRQSATVTPSGQPDYILAYFDLAGFDTTKGTLTDITLSFYGNVQEYGYYPYAIASSSMSPVTFTFEVSLYSNPLIYKTQYALANTVRRLTGGVDLSVSSGFSFISSLSPSFVQTHADGTGFAGNISSLLNYNNQTPQYLDGTIEPSVTAQYTYTPFAAATDVPEPATLALLGTAALIPVVRRRRAAR